MASVASSSAQTWAMFKEQVDDTLIKALQPRIIYNLIAKVYPATQGVVAWDKTNDSWLNPTEIAESGEYPNAVMNFARTYISMKDIGLAPRLPINWIKDARFDLITEYIEEIGFGIARYLNADLLSAMNIWVGGGTYNGDTFSAVSNHVTEAAAVWSDNSADIVDDIMAADAALAADDAGDGMKYLVLHPTPMRYLLTDPQFLKFSNYGNNDLITKGIFPTPYGITILRTSQAATTYALLVNVDMSAIKYYEREPLSTEVEKSARSQHIDIVARMRYAFACGRPKGLVKINTIASE